MSDEAKKSNGSVKSAEKRYGLVRVKTASEARKALKLKSPRSYKIHELLAIPASR